jgi:hypothetical protein
MENRELKVGQKSIKSFCLHIKKKQQNQVVSRIREKKVRV